VPITPFHLGPALPVKVACGRRFSLTVFAFSQILIDVEVAIRLVHGSAVLHGFSHTLLGATLAAVASVVVGRPVSERLLCWWLGEPIRIASTVAWASACAGAYSHLVLDGMMHLDMRPFAPLTDANPILGALSTPAIYLVCTITGALGALGWHRNLEPDRSPACRESA
jgi:hypothetical protein